MAKFKVKDCPRCQIRLIKTRYAHCIDCADAVSNEVYLKALERLNTLTTPQLKSFIDKYKEG